MSPEDTVAGGPRVEAVFIESFLGGSHESFARGWIAHSRHDWRMIGLPARFWKWRQRLAAWPLGRRLAALSPAPRVVVTTGLIDLAHLKLASGLSGRAAFLLYLHENQLSYPRPAGKPLDRSFAVSHVASLLAADSLAMNSRSHRDAMRAELGSFLAEVPPPRPAGCLTRLGAARILYPGVDLDGFPEPSGRPAGRPPVVLWNHRWEEDKRPGAFARVLLRLAESGRDFRLVLIGTGDQVEPQPLLLLREKLGPRILRDRPARRGREYRRWLRRADVTVSTAAQENFGYATVEAMAAGAVPLLPRRLSYPELIPRRLGESVFYDTDDELFRRLRSWIDEPRSIERLRRPVMQAARRHSWSRRTKALDDWVAAAAARAPHEEAS